MESSKEKKAPFAMGTKPQILSSKKQEPLGTGLESLGEGMAVRGEVGSMEEMHKREEELVRSGHQEVQLSEEH